MSSVDLEKLLQPISADEPSGPDLEYDPDAAELEQASKGKAEQQFGDTIVEAEDPDWKSAKRLASSLLERTKDLRFALHLGNSCLYLGELDGFKDVTGLLLGYISDFWESVHPQLDPDDDNDPTERVNAVASIQDPNVTLKLLRSLPLVALQGFGQFSFEDIQVGKGESTPAAGVDPVPMSTIEGAFQDCDVDELQRTHNDIVTSRDNLQSLEARLTELVGVQNTLSLDPICDLLGEIGAVLSGYIQLRGGSEPEPDAAAAETEEAETSQTGVSASNGASANAEIRGREDVIRAIDRICAYYERYEPSSPLPLLLLRAKRLATKSFLEIIEDLAPDGLQQANAMGGIASEGAEESDDNNSYDSDF